MQTRLTLYDISGSMNLANKAYNVISIIRVDNIEEESREYEKLEKQLLKAKYNIKETSTILEVLKTKGNSCGLVPMIFEKETKTFIQQPQMTSEMYEKTIHSQPTNSNKPMF
jgi:hypothetical protein